MNRLEYATYLYNLNQLPKEETVDIIILDDFEMNNYILKKMINTINNKLKIETVNKAEDLLGLLMRYKPKILFIDLMLGNSFSGMKLVEDLISNTNEIKIIAYSGLEEKFINESLPKLDVLSKPISIEKVKEMLNNNI